MLKIKFDTQWWVEMGDCIIALVWTIFSILYVFFHGLPYPDNLYSEIILVILGSGPCYLLVSLIGHLYERYV